jgi:sterol desaturase/sphingolipid hydroxylase (fatty acid hydroxylase superfamily)
MEQEPLIRLVAFLGIFGTMALFELWSPRLERDALRGALKSQRWITNLGMLLISAALMRLIFPAAVVGAAVWAEAKGFGLLRALAVPEIIAGLIAFIILDFAVWLEHVVSHRWHWLWRIHRVHHADPGFDVTTALRFHPAEILVSMAWKSAVVIALGAPVIAVLIFEIVLNGMAMFNHANVKLPPRLDAALRVLFVTPDMHRVHHSQDELETNSNYGFNFSIWDRFFAVYRSQPALGATGLEIGLKEFEAKSASRLGWSMLLPFKR